MDFKCTDAQMAKILSLVDDQTKAETICSTYNVNELGTTNAVLKYSIAYTAEVQTSTNAFFLCNSAYLVFVMQAGFAMVCAGCVRAKNTLNILLKNVIDACVAGVFFYLIGYAFAFGAKGDTNAFIGNWDFSLSHSDSMTPIGGWPSFIFQWAFSAAAATIVSGAVAERCTFIAYISYSAFITAFVYPVVVHWLWSSDGWLSAFRTSGKKLLDMGAIDFAGSGVVHMVGGAAAAAGATIMGPRIGRFDADGKPAHMPGHNGTLVVLGTFLLWFGWYGFNPGSQLAVANYVSADIMSRVAVTTTIGGSAGALASLLYSYITKHELNTINVCNGLLAGLVAITSPCPVVQPWAAIIIGGIAGPLQNFVEETVVLKMLKIDDPVGAIAVHWASGAWGVLSPGLLAHGAFVQQVYSTSGKKGIFYGGDGHILGCQIVEIVVITAWVGGLMAAFFLLFKVVGLLRVTPEVELAGLDVSKHGGSAYHTEDLHVVKKTNVSEA